MTPVQLLGGILLATAIFGAFLWSGYQGVVRRGRLRRAHLILVLMTLMAVFTLDRGMASPAQILGYGLVLLGLWAAWLETGLARGLPLVQSGLGLALILQLPFGGT